MRFSCLTARGGGVLPIRGIRGWRCHLTGMVWQKIALHKGPHLKVCLTKGSLFGPKSVLQKGPFLLKIEVSPLKNACFANFKRKIFCKSTESHIFCILFLKFALRDRSLFMAGGDRVQMTFYKKIFHGPLVAGWKTFAAHSTPRDNFLTPPLGVRYSCILG